MSTSDYRRPGVYLEEVLQTSPVQSGSAVAVAGFSGVAPKGDAFIATRIESWSDYVQKFGGFDAINVVVSGTPTRVLSYLPYAVFSFYQNGGRVAYIVRVLPSATVDQGTIAKVDVVDAATPTPHPVFSANASGAGDWGNTITITFTLQTTTSLGDKVFTVFVKNGAQIVETFPNLSMTGVEGTRPIITALNDPLAGSRYVDIKAPVTAPPAGAAPKEGVYTLTGGINPGVPVANDLSGTPVTDAFRAVDNPLVISFQPFRNLDNSIVQATPISSSAINKDRFNCFMVWDCPPVSAGGSDFYTAVTSRANATGNSETYSAYYTPWIVVPDPARPGSTISVPPSGSVQGMMARIDATMGVWRAPAGIPAVLTTAVAPEWKFPDTQQGDLNAANINVVRAVPGAGLCVMGARTRKLYGPDRYVSARRTLIYIEDSLKLSTYFAIFENNDERLWSALRTVANNILQPMWERGGLAGASAAQAYFVTCDSTLNTPQVVQSGEVRMEVGVALQYPAEFVIIRISQFDSGASFTNEVTAA